MGNMLFAGDTPDKAEKAIFAGGCFWWGFDNLPGVISTRVGYTGGSEEAPTYEQVAAHRTGHREAIEITYDPAKVSYTKLLGMFWQNIDPTQANGQFYDVGHQYTTAIYFTSPEQQKLAQESKEALDKSGKFKRPIATAIEPAAKFWPAEDYHQKYYIKCPTRFEAYHEGSGRADYVRKTWGKEKH